MTVEASSNSSVGTGNDVVEMETRMKGVDTEGFYREFSAFGLSEAEVNQLVLAVFRDGAEIALALTAIYAKQVEANNDKVDFFTHQSDRFLQLAKKAGNDNDGLVDADYHNMGPDWKQVGRDFAEVGEVPSWLSHVAGGAKPTKVQLEAISAMYANRASSAQAEGTLILTNLNLVNNTSSERTQMISALLSLYHNTALFVIQKYG